MARVIKSKYQDVAVPEVPFQRYVLAMGSLYKDKLAYIEDGTGRQYTYGDLVKNCKSVASAFIRKGIKKGDVVLIFSSNNIDYPVAYLGLGVTGAIPTTCNPLYKKDEVLHHLKDSGATHIIVHSAFVDTAKAAANEHGNIKEIYVFGKSVEGCTSFEDLKKDDGSAYNEDDVKFDVHKDIAAMPYSSGTTGLPKGVEQTHYAFMAAMQIINHPEFTTFTMKNDVCLGVVPFFHILGMGIYMGVALSTGATIIVQERFVPENFIKAIEKYKVTQMHIVPPIAVLLAKHPLVTQIDTSTVRSIGCAAAPLGKELTEEVLARLGGQVEVRQLFGMTETLATHNFPKGSDVVHGSVGNVMPSVQVKVVNLSTGALCGPMEQGEICMKGPCIMVGYHNKPEANKSTIDEEGYVHSGDIGYYDEKEQFYIVDRRKELIKYNANQVAPAELENLLLTHPAVVDSAVIGVPDPKAGELPKAYVVKKPNVDVTAQDIITFVEERVAPFKKLRGGVEFIDKIPKSASGKILRRILRDQAADSLKEG